MYLELNPDNDAKRMAVADHGFLTRGYLKKFLDMCIQDAKRQPYIPDNLIFYYRDIPSGNVPLTEERHIGDKDQVLRFIISNGINDNNTIPLRKAAYLHFFGRKITPEALKELGKEQSYKQFEAHEDAMKALQQGRPVKMTLTIAETNMGMLVFSDSLPGKKAQKDYLQYVADSFFQPAAEGLEFLQLYRFETSSGQLIGLADTCCHVDEHGQIQYDFTPSMNSQLSLLNDRTPMIGFDMRPTCQNLDTFLGHTGTSLSAHNDKIMMLESIARDGYNRSDGENFPYRKEFRDIEESIRKMQRESRNNSSYPFKEKYDQIQEQARQLARNILQRDLHPRSEKTPEQILHQLYPRKVSREARPNTRNLPPRKTQRPTKTVKHKL